MFPISTAFQRVLDSRVGRNRSIVWWGRLTLVNGVNYDFNADHIAQGTGSLTSECDIPGIGGTSSTGFQAQFFLPVDPRSLKNAIIVLYVRLIDSSVVSTWGEAADYNWLDISCSTWGDSQRTLYVDVPMGEYLIMDAKRAINSIKIEANDYMQKFDTKLPSMDTTARTPFNWLRWMCTRCGVELGMTNTEIAALVNGSRSFTYADVDTEVKTYRDLLSHLAAVLGGVAVINRYGKLVIVRLDPEPVAEITPDNRFSSEYADNQSYYTGITAQYKAKAVQEYFNNTVRLLDDTGLILNLGVNVFLQISHNTNRTSAVQAIIDSLKGVLFTPFSATVPLNPAFDLLDTLSFSGGHAPAGSKAPITSIIRTIGGGMSMSCATPEEQENPVRETTQIDGLSGSGSVIGTVYASSDFWIMINAAPEADVVIGDDALVNELTVNCTVDDTCTQIAWTGTYTLDEDATVTAKVYVDDDLIYQVSDDQKAGNHTLNITTGHDITTQGEHTVRIILREDVL